MILHTSILLLLLSAGGEQHTSQRVERKITEVIDTQRLRKEADYCHVAMPRLGRRGDKGGPPSMCVLLEDGKPLGPPRALHADIRKKGRGRYSHWTQRTLYFSTSDNSDPRTNGRKYTLVSLRRSVRHKHVVRVGPGETSYRIKAHDSRRIVNSRVSVRHLGGQRAVVTTFKRPGWPDLTSVDGMLKSILKPGMSDEAKAIAIWRFLRDWRYHYYPAEGGDEVHDPVKFINVYGYGFCDDSASNFAVLARAAGVRARIWGLSGHVVGEAFYAGRWHMFDPDLKVYYRTKAGHVASVDELGQRVEMITAAAQAAGDSEVTREDFASAAHAAKLYSTTKDNRPSERKYRTGHRLLPTLQPGDQVVFDFAGRERPHSILFRDKPLAPTFGTGRLVRKLDLRAAGKKADVEVVWPYVILGGQLQLPAAGAAVEIRTADRPPQRLKSAKTGDRWVVSLDDWFHRGKGAHYSYQLRIAGSEASGQAALVTTFQFAPRVLPQVGRGERAFHWTVRPAAGGPLPADWRGLEVTHEWHEVIKDEPPK